MVTTPCTKNMTVILGEKFDQKSAAFLCLHPLLELQYKLEEDWLDGKKLHMVVTPPPCLGSEIILCIPEKKVQLFKPGTMVSTPHPTAEKTFDLKPDVETVVVDLSWPPSCGKNQTVCDPALL